MTLEGAQATAKNAAIRFGKPFVVYRFPAWPPECWGVIAEDRELAPTAEIRERFAGDVCQPSVPKPTGRSESSSQRSLF